MNRVSLAFLAAALTALAVASTAGGAAPRIVMVSGEPLEQHVVITDWSRIFTMVQAIREAPVRTKARLDIGPRLKVSSFWGPRWDDYLRDGKSPAKLRPRHTSDHGYFYPGWHGRRPLIDLPWAGKWPRVVPPKALNILQRYGVPRRLK